ncbi:SAM-dependent DNA methyltransferase [Leptolyngbya sp. 7M]|uniref:SAM-dependent DNA methyltransferase n=1 Tax=Leptolyngbya sp. 7M TaxID=2812896 RepID=UPI001B8AC05A|nr:SAM-dependent DNA methyltransferase [Leptolyngbya sp. 7M]QYO62569.1 hypothetical protein JVX88_21215 [Leptolyngbya sp. 7M]
MSESKEPNLYLNAFVEEIAAIIDVDKRKITNRELLKLCTASGIKSLSTDSHLCHEIAETAVNHLFCTQYGKPLLDSADPAAACSQILRPLQERLPTQTWRSSTQITYQQFSTPVTIAYLAAYLLDLKSNDIVLEPSCGTGSLAVWAYAAGATVITNEIDPRRRGLATFLGLDPTGHDAEFIDDLQPENVIPNVILANPPFSSSGGRTERNQRKLGFRHVESALRRLDAGGRFAVILGESGSLRSGSGKMFWESLSSDIRVTASIELPGSEYYKNGTNVGVTLILGYKLVKQDYDGPASVEHSFIISASSVEDAFEKALSAGLRFKPSF